MTTDADGRPSTPPKAISPLPPEARPYQGHRAGVVTRMVAATIDSLVVGAVLMMGYVGYAALVFLVDPRSFSFPTPGVFFSLTAGLTVLVVYLAGSWWVGGRTYGCHLMGLRVVNYNGANMRLLGALLRALFCAFVPIGLLWVAINRENRSVQDIVLRTSVIYDWQPRH